MFMFEINKPQFILRTKEIQGSQKVHRKETAFEMSTVLISSLQNKPMQYALIYTDI